MSSVNLTNKEVFDRIKYFRKQKRMSAFDLSRELGHSATYLYRLEKGEIDLSISTLFSILDILNVNTFEFFYPTLDRFEEDLTILDRFNFLNDTDRAYVLKHINFRLSNPPYKNINNNN